MEQLIVKLILFVVYCYFFFFNK